MTLCAQRAIGALLFVISLAASAPAQTGQTSAPPPANTQTVATSAANPKETLDPDAASAKAHGILDDGLKTTGLTARDWKPWHMKANFEVFDQGVVSEAGTLEQWWTSPYQWRRTYTTKKQTGTEWSVTRGLRFQTKPVFPFSMLDLRVAGPLVAPLAQAANFKPEYSMDWKQLNAGATLNCVSVLSPQRYTDLVDPDFLFPRFCFDTGSRLRLLGTSDTAVSFNKYELFHDRAIAAKIDVNVSGQKKASMEITLLESLAAPDEALVPPDNTAVPQPLELTAQDPAPVPVHQEAADLPAAAMKQQMFGTVSVPVLILKDGRVKLNGQAFGPPLLTQPAADSIVRWRYEPYVVDGETVEVSTRLSYVFDAKPFVPQAGKAKLASNSGYDPRRDPEKDLAQAIAEAKQSNKRILMELGGDWCVWCANLDRFFADHPGIDKLRDANYVTLKVNVSSNNGNRLFLTQYPKVSAYPHIFILDADGKLLQSQDTGELERGSGYNEERIRDFLMHWKSS